MNTNDAGNDFSQVIDNFLPEQQFNEISNLLMGNGMIWNYNDVVDYQEGTQNQFQLTHTFFSLTKGYMGPLTSVIDPFVDLLKMKVLIRIKANLNVRSTENNRESKFHYDHEFVGSRLPDGTLTSYTAIYYVNTNNGYTLFKDGNFKVDSVANRMVIFDSSKLHKAVGCTDKKRRVVINFNYFTSLYGSKDQTAASIKLFNEANA